MRRVTLVLALMLCSASSALAEIEFDGGVCFTSVTAACQPSWTANSCFTARYAPRSIGTNGLDTELSLFQRSFAVGFKLAGGNPVSPTNYTVSMAKVARGGYSYSLGFRFTSQAPATPLATSDTISFTGVFTNWDQINGCNVTFRGFTTRRP